MNSTGPKSKRGRHFGILLLALLLALSVRIGPLGDFFLKTAVAVSDKGKGGDLDEDGDIDIDDVVLFSDKCLKKRWDAVDWCQWIEQGAHVDKDNKEKCESFFEGLHDFLVEYFLCDEHEPSEPAKLVNNRKDFPTRMALGDDGILYVCDNRVNQVVMYDVFAVIEDDPVTGEEIILDVILSDRGRISVGQGPLGIALDADGNIYVGSSGRHNVEVYSPSGQLLRIIGQDQIEMPNDLDFDLAGNLYVVDSKWNIVRVYNPAGEQIRIISDGNMKHPTAVEVAYRPSLGREEVFVADQKNHAIKVFDPNGTLVRSFGTRIRGGMFGGNWKWKGRFADLQALEMDSAERLHVLDCYINTVQILNPDVPGGYGDGIFYGSYGWRGSEEGLLKTPLDVALIELFGRAVVANYGNKRIEIMAVP
ncbi:MAG: NHL repeat-containing protein [Planctomycetota bacterium]